VIDYSAALAQVCAMHVSCRFDGNAVFNYPVFNYPFTLSHVPT
jgi:hypothetical protein